ncbi:DUF2255 family protein [Ferrimonas kyonanensis]|uniref:DUF2255 family protein n=1 Tax=Ferrimonas kyonanensis TaxID=364763 RepID=UPI0004822B4B|nr:DUF2255 family protein [Ferrimonas kyonanensis]
MAHTNFLKLTFGFPRLILLQAIKPLRLALRKSQEPPKSQQEMAQMIEKALSHEIRAGYTHRFIPLLFVTVNERVFCRRYSYSEPSWHSSFGRDPTGQIRLDKTTVDIRARLPQDLEEVLPVIDLAYTEKLKQLGASFLLAGATEPRAQNSTLELTLANKPGWH